MGLKKGNFRQNEGLSVGPVAPNEVVKGSKLAPLVSMYIHKLNLFPTAQKHLG